MFKELGVSEFEVVDFVGVVSLCHLFGDVTHSNSWHPQVSILKAEELHLNGRGNYRVSVFRHPSDASVVDGDDASVFGDGSHNDS